ncbi:hypothetical protein HK103_004529 [Boothiomyces macroporosus]|uniref:Uncharacterized protein n=1 Tax=Boothiomyces macroporosus TaxID=261099 RepID=A0AAD5UJ40_9FUNG|nr:hypothetical protein HK103_004529 [Boothiomyces macroporosus]
MGIIFVSLAILYENLQALFVLKVVLKEMKSKHGKISIRYKAAMLKNIINLIFGIAGIVAIFLSFLATGDTASIAGVLGEAIFGNQVSLLVDTFKIVAKIPIGDTKIHPQTDSEMTSQRVTESKEVEDQDVNQPDSGDGKGSVSRKGLEVAISEPPPIAGSPNSVRHAQIVLPIGVENGLPNKLPPLPTDPHRLTKKKSLHQTIVEKKLSEIHSEISSIKSRESSFAKDNQDI